LFKIPNNKNAIQLKLKNAIQLILNGIFSFFSIFVKDVQACQPSFFPSQIGGSNPNPLLPNCHQYLLANCRQFFV